MVNVIRTINLEGGLSTPGTSAGVTGRGVLLLEEETIAFGLPSSKPLASPPLPNDNTCSLAVCAPLRFVANRVLTAPPPERPERAREMEPRDDLPMPRYEDSERDLPYARIIDDVSEVKALLNHLLEKSKEIFNPLHTHFDIEERCQDILDRIAAIEPTITDPGQATKLAMVKGHALFIHATILLELAIFFDVGLEDDRFRKNLDSLKEKFTLAATTAKSDGFVRLAVEKLEVLSELDCPTWSGLKRTLMDLRMKAAMTLLSYIKKVPQVRFYPVFARGLDVDTFDESVYGDRFNKTLEKCCSEAEPLLFEALSLFRRSMEVARSKGVNRGDIVEQWGRMLREAFEINEYYGSMRAILKGEPPEGVERVMKTCRDVVSEAAYEATSLMPDDKMKGQLLEMFAGMLREYSAESKMPAFVVDDYRIEAIRLLMTVQDLFLADTDLAAFERASNARYETAQTIVDAGLKAGEVKAFFDNLPVRREKFLKNEKVLSADVHRFFGIIYFDTGAWEKGLEEENIAAKEYRALGRYTMVENVVGGTLNRVMGIIRQKEKDLQVSGDAGVAQFRGGLMDKERDDLSRLERERAGLEAALAKVKKYSGYDRNISGILKSMENFQDRSTNIALVERIIPMLCEASTFAISSGEKPFRYKVIRLWKEVAEECLEIVGYIKERIGSSPDPEATASQMAHLIEKYAYIYGKVADCYTEKDELFEKVDAKVGQYWASNELAEIGSRTYIKKLPELSGEIYGLVGRLYQEGIAKSRSGEIDRKTLLLNIYKLAPERRFYTLFSLEMHEAIQEAWKGPDEGKTPAAREVVHNLIEEWIDGMKVAFEGEKFEDFLEIFISEVKWLHGQKKNTYIISLYNNLKIYFDEKLVSFVDGEKDLNKVFRGLLTIGRIYGYFKDYGRAASVYIDAAAVAEDISDTKEDYASLAEMYLKAYVYETLLLEREGSVKNFMELIDKWEDIRFISAIFFGRGFKVFEGLRLYAGFNVMRIVRAARSADGGSLSAATEAELEQHSSGAENELDSLMGKYMSRLREMPEYHSASDAEVRTDVLRLLMLYRIDGGDNDFPPEGWVRKRLAAEGKVGGVVPIAEQLGLESEWKKAVDYMNGDALDMKEVLKGAK